MQIVIDIPKEIYKASQIVDVKYEDTIQIPLEVVANGTPLPKGCDIQRIIPKRVDVMKWIHTECPNPNCDYELSTHHGDGVLFH